MKMVHTSKLNEMDLIKYIDREYIHGLILKALKEKSLIEQTAIRDCHIEYLHSFIISTNPKTRLFIAESYCPLMFQYHIDNPAIPIHPHKHTDVFCVLTGNLTHHMYEVGGYLSFQKCQYYRLTGEERITKIIGRENLKYLGPTNKQVLNPHELHSVSLKGKNGLCAWTVTEIDTDADFEPIGYCKELSDNSDLYQKFENATLYVKKIMEEIKNEHFVHI